MVSPVRVVVGGIKVGKTDLSRDAWDDDEMGGGVDVFGDGGMDGDAGEYENAVVFCFSKLLSNFSNKSSK